MICLIKIVIFHSYVQRVAWNAPVEWAYHPLKLDRVQLSRDQWMFSLTHSSFVNKVFSVPSGKITTVITKTGKSIRFSFGKQQMLYKSGWFSVAVFYTGRVDQLEHIPWICDPEITTFLMWRRGGGSKGIISCPARRVGQHPRVGCTKWRFHKWMYPTMVGL